MFCRFGKSMIIVVYIHTTCICLVYIVIVTDPVDEARKSK